MYRLAALDLDQLPGLSDALRALGDGAETMEEAADRIVRHLRAHLVDGDGVDPACALVRLYVTHPFGHLEPDLQEFARGLLDEEPDRDVRCLTLLATAGDLPEWNSRYESAAHRAIPLPSPEMVRRLPMVTQLIEQLGLSLEDVVAPRADRVVALAQKTYGVFHVPDAPGSASIPAQEDFVVPFGIRSAVGFGGMLTSGAFYAVVLFSRVPVDERVAKNLKILALPVRTALLPFTRERVFAMRARS